MTDQTCKTCKYCEYCEYVGECGLEYGNNLDKNPVCRHPSIVCDDEYQCSCKVVKWDSYCSDWAPKEEQDGNA